LFLIFGCSVFFHFHGVDGLKGRGSAIHTLAAVMGKNSQGSVSARKRLLFVLDFDDFSCMMCLESFLDCYSLLPPQVKFQDSFGVLVGVEDRREEKDLAIMRKKLRGFIKANAIVFPVFLDERGVFDSAGREGSCVILMDEKSGDVRRFVFPLKKGEMGAILEELVE